MQVLGVQQLVHQAVQACDVDIRALMYQNIVVTGGNTLYSGFCERFIIKSDNFRLSIDYNLNSHTWQLE